jgi:hypothetical protein
MLRPLLLTSLFFIFQCDILQAQADFQSETDAWHAQRVSALKAEDGWLNLAGLHWLGEGVQTFGSDSSCAIVFPRGRITGLAGSFERRGNVVIIRSSATSGIRINGRRAGADTIFSPSLPVAPTCSAGSLRWTIIQRGVRIGIRLRDPQVGLEARQPVFESHAQIFLLAQFRLEGFEVPTRGTTGESQQTQQHSQSTATGHNARNRDRDRQPPERKRAERVPCLVGGVTRSL